MDNRWRKSHTKDTAEDNTPTADTTLSIKSNKAWHYIAAKLQHLSNNTQPEISNADANHVLCYNHIAADASS